jgi:hypothetical protein
MPITVARAYIAEAKIEETEHFFGRLNADDLDALRSRDPLVIASKLTGLARQFHALASALGELPQGAEHEEQQVA